MVKEYEVVFASSVYEQLRKKVIGKVTVYFRNDVLYVMIDQQEVNLHFKYSTTDMAHKIINGLSASTITYAVCKQYSKFINGLYFK